MGPAETRKPATGDLRTVHVVANPAAGADEIVLATLNDTWADAGLRWDVSVTLGPGDGERLAREAAEDGAPVVAAYGGDGTVAEVASALAGTDVPMLLLPGGTGNVMAHELGIPLKLSDAAAVLLGPRSERRIDVAATDRGRTLVLRAGIGWEADAVEGAPRELKDKLGYLAYLVSGVRGVVEPSPRSRYRISVDGVEYQDEGVTCVVANSASLGMGDLVLHPEVAVDDGWLDAVVIRRSDPPSLLRLASGAARGKPADDLVGHFKGRDVRVEAEPRQAVVLDGESAGDTPLRAWVLPGAVRVLVPARSGGVESGAEHVLAAGGR
ncbi:MAG: diacylglycerol kinase family lipid kinase [Coriobacteriia bacterium]|nr:diacylglycerol kinase family lipid kinase [Coriobacteriia bacterium]